MNDERILNDIYDDAFERYGTHRPTPFDRNICLDDDDNERSQWFLMPVTRTRDSQPIDNVNFDAFLEGLGGESETVEVHRFGHWGPGWYEIIIVSPKDHDALAAAYDMARALEDYPVLNDDALSAAEYEAAEESWDNWARREIQQRLSGMIERHLIGEYEGTLNEEYDEDWDVDPEFVADEYIDRYIDQCGFPSYEMHGDGPYFDINGIADKLFAEFMKDEDI